MACWHSMSFHQSSQHNLKNKAMFCVGKSFSQSKYSYGQRYSIHYWVGFIRVQEDKRWTKAKRRNCFQSLSEMHDMMHDREEGQKWATMTPWQTCFYRTQNMQHYMMWTSANRILMRLCVGKTFWKKKSIFQAKDIFIVCCIYHVGIMR